MYMNSESRYILSDIYVNEDEELFFAERPRAEYEGGNDENMHEVVDGDTLFNLAARYFAQFTYPAGLWWIIGDFQPDPISDPTLLLTPGTFMAIPSPAAVQVILESLPHDDEGVL